MAGDRGRTIETECESDSIELPSLLAQLDSQEPATQHHAVSTIRAAVDEEPARWLPTVPKLRGLLEAESIDCHEEMAHCLAVFAEESPADVAPSVEHIVSFILDNETHPATQNLFRCLDAVATDWPDAVVDHTDAIVSTLETQPEPDLWGLHVLETLSIAYPKAVEPAVPVLTEALRTDPERTGPATLPALGRIVRSNETATSLEFVDDALSLIDHDDPTVRNNAIGCLADVARYNPAVVESSCPQIATVLDCEDSTTRANAAVTIARVAAGTDAAVEPARDDLRALLDDHDARVRANACLALGYGGVDGAADRLEALAQDDPDRTVRERASWVVDQLLE